MFEFNKKLAGIILIIFVIVNIIGYLFFPTALQNLLKKMKSMFFTILPIHVITSFFGIGFFPAWQAHWASFVAMLISFLIFIFFSGINTPDIFSITFYGNLSIAMIVISFVSILLLKWRDGDDTEMDKIMIHIASGQIFCIFLSIPSIRYILFYVSDFYSGICNNFVYCAYWAEASINYITSLILFFTVYRFIDDFNPWPSGYFEKDMRGPLGYTIFPLINAFYTAIVLDAFFIVFCGMKISDLINIYKSAFIDLYKILNI